MAGDCTFRVRRNYSALIRGCQLRCGKSWGMTLSSLDRAASRMEATRRWGRAGESSSRQGGQSPKPASRWGARHTVSFVGKIQIRLVPDPLEQSLGSLRGGLVPGQRGGKSIWLANESPQELSPRSIILSTSSSRNRSLSPHIFMENVRHKSGFKDKGARQWTLWLATN